MNTMCTKTVRFPSIIDESTSNKNAVEMYRKSVEMKPTIDESSKLLIESAWEAVLDEQVDQWAAGESDPERMATVYRQLSATSQVRAIVDGLKVQEEAAKCAAE